jgi:hypothetical protein
MLMRSKTAETRAGRIAIGREQRICSYHRGFLRSREPRRATAVAVILSSTAYNRADRSQARIKSMEAERVNQIANLLSDLQQRAADLRRYL